MPQHLNKLCVLIALIVISFSAYAQAPNLLNYQGVARNAVGNPLPNQTMNLRLSVHNLMASGATVYTETRVIKTNLGGLFSVQIGSAGTTSATGTIDAVNWLSGDKYLQVEIDPASNNNYLNMGTVQLISVPYAFNAATAGTASTATKLATARNINGVAFDGSSDVTIPAIGAIPYTGATQAVDLGAFDLKVNGLTVGHGSGNIASNTANGYNAIYSNTTGFGNTANGYNALYSNKQGIANTVSGYEALYNNTSAYNTAMGYRALYSNTSGSANTASGLFTLFSNTTGVANMASGVYALYSNTKGFYNTASGNRALYSNTEGGNNTASGNYALYSNTTGSGNTVSGNEALYSNTTGSYNTAIGYKTDVISGALTNATAIGNQASVSASNTIQLGNTSVTNVNTSGTLTAGTVTYPNISGTANQVLTTNGLGTASWQALTAADAGTLTGTTINSTVTGSSLTSVGTITTGVWSGTAVAVEKGGTGLTAAGTNGQVLTSTGSGTLAWTTPVFLPTIVIGTQQWMEKNLDVLTYRDGTIIPQVTDQTAWAGLTTGAWCWYNNSADNGAIYGKLYNWYAVNDVIHGGIAPQGWHIPTDAEWTILGSLLGGDEAAGGKMKTTGFTRWSSPNISATNESGFASLPGGGRFVNGLFGNAVYDGYWWSATQASSTHAFYRHMGFYQLSLVRYTQSKIDGFSVRCLRD